MDHFRTLGRELAMSSQAHLSPWSSSASASSKEFLDLIKSIGEARSKSEEDRIVLAEIAHLRAHISSPDVSKSKMKEYLLRLVYVEMLGHDAAFGHIHAVKMTHEESLFLKRVGYLAVTLFLNEDHDLIILIVNTIQRDLKSDNYLVVCAALGAVCKLINEETIPAVVGQVVELLGHRKEEVRRKAVMALHRFYRRSPGSVSHLVSNFRERLCDNDPGVMGATLCPFYDLISADANAYKDLLISFVSILKQVAERRLPKSYDYHMMPAPFIQIRLLKILALLGSGDKQASEKMYTVLGDIFRKGDSSSNIGNAILYECICCVSSIYPSPKLLDAAAEVTSKFLKNESYNLKYMGIDALGRLLKINPDIAEKHQLDVIDCLEDPDDTLKRKTFELLYKMTKSSNVEVIVDRMIDYMIDITDNHYKSEIASRCVELAEQFAPNNQWFIQTMNKVFEYAGDLVNVKVAHNLMRLIAEGFGEDESGEDCQLRSFAVESYLRLVSEPKLPSQFLQIICWVLGEYGTADGKYSASYITGKLCDVADAHSADDLVKGYAVTAIMKVCAFEIASGRRVEVLPECQSLIDELSASHSTDLQQRAYELQAVFSLDAPSVERIMPLDASCEDIEVDKNLTFLNSYVEKSLENGAKPYIPEDVRSVMLDISGLRSEDQPEASSHALRFEAYELPKPSVHAKSPAPHSFSTDLVPLPEPTYVKEGHATTLPSESGKGAMELKLQLDGVQKKWGKPTYSPAPSTSNSNSPKPVNGVTQVNGGGTSSSQNRDVSYSSKRSQVEVNPEKQKLAASLFGGSSSKSERRSSSSGHKKKPELATATATSAGLSSEKAAPVQPPPDLVDWGEETTPSNTPAVDPFTQLEDLIGPSQVSSNIDSETVGATKSPDLLAMYETPTSGLGNNMTDLLQNGKDGTNPTVTSANSASNNGGNTLSGGSIGTHPSPVKKGPSSRDALEKHAMARQVGVTPSGTNPNLFKDLLG